MTGINASAVRKLDRDKLAMVSRDTTADVAMAALTPIQSRQPHEIAAGVAMLYVTLCTRCGLTGSEMWDQASRMLETQAHHVRANDSLQSLRDFAGIRMAGDAGTTVS